MGRSLRLVLPLGLVLTLAMSLPLAAVAHKGFVYSAKRPESHDFLLNAWILAWGAHAVTTPGESIFDTNAFYPRRNTLAYSDHLLGNLPFTLPLFWARANPILVHNVLLLLSFLLSFVGMWALTLRLTGSWAGALFAGFVYAFCPFRFSNIERLQILSCQWMPFSMLFLHRFLDRRRAVDLVWAGVFAFVQAMVSCYYALMFPVFLALWLGAVWVASWSTAALGCASASTAGGRCAPFPRPRGVVLGFAAIALGYVLLCLPFFWPYVELEREFGFSRPVGENVRHSADVLNYLTAPDTSLLYGRALRRWAGDGNELFPGLLVTALAGVALLGALRRRGDRAIWAYAFAGVACALFALGPVVRLAGRELCPGPYMLLYRFVPGFAGLRNPTRFGMLFMLSLAVLSGYGYQALLRRLARTQPSSLRYGVFALATFVVTSAEYCCVPLGCSNYLRGEQIPEVYRWLARNDSVRVVLELPFDLDVADRRYLYYSTYHWKRLVNGVSGWAPPEDLAKYLSFAQFPAPDIVQLLSDLGVDCVLLHDGHTAFPGLQPSVPGMRTLAKFGNTVAMAPQVPSQGLDIPMPTLSECDRARWRVSADPRDEDAHYAVDGRLSTAWSTQRPQRPGDCFTLDLGESVTVASVHMWLGQESDKLPLHCAVQCAASPSEPFHTLAVSAGNATYYRTCLLDVRDARLVIDFPPTRCRLLRLVHCGKRAHRFARPWAIAEVAVFPPAAPHRPPASRPPSNSARASE